MATPGTVRSWNGEEGWGVIDSAETPGGCWAHYSMVAKRGFRSLTAGQVVELEWEAPGQDGYDFRAIRIWSPGEEPYEHPVQWGSGGAYTSSLTLTFDPEE